MFRLLTRTKTTTKTTIKTTNGFDLTKVQHQLVNAQDFIAGKLKDLKPESLPGGFSIENVQVKIDKKTALLKELAEVSQRNNSHWMIMVTEENWINQIIKSLKSTYPQLSPSKKDSNTITIPIPKITRKKTDILQDCKDTVENSKLTIRNIRASARADLKKSGLSKDEIFDLDKEIEELVKKSLGKVDQLFTVKKQELQK